MRIAGQVDKQMSAQQVHLQHASQPALLGIDPRRPLSYIIIIIIIYYINTHARTPCCSYIVILVLTAALRYHFKLSGKHNFCRLSVNVKRYLHCLRRSESVRYEAHGTLNYLPRQTAFY